MFKIDADEVIKLTVTLEKLNRSALPSAVRNTLNNAAFETKQQIPIEGSKRFITRNKGFLKAFSTVDKASGFDIDKMRATAGINSSRGERVADGLVAQEFGGSLHTSRLVPHDEARTSKSHRKRLRKKNWLSKVNAHNASGAFKSHKGTRNSKFVAAVMSTAKRGKKHMILESGGRGMLYEIKSLKSSRSTGRLSFKLDKLFYLKRSSEANVSGRGFIRASKDAASKKLPEFYKSNAEYQLKKHWR